MKRTSLIYSALAAVAIGFIAMASPAMAMTGAGMSEFDYRIAVAVDPGGSMDTIQTLASFDGLKFIVSEKQAVIPDKVQGYQSYSESPKSLNHSKLIALAISGPPAFHTRC